MKVADTWEFPIKEYVRCSDNSVEEDKLKFRVFKTWWILVRRCWIFKKRFNESLKYFWNSVFIISKYKGGKLLNASSLPYLIRIYMLKSFKNCFQFYFKLLVVSPRFQSADCALTYLQHKTFLTLYIYHVFCEVLLVTEFCWRYSFQEIWLQLCHGHSTLWRS